MRKFLVSCAALISLMGLGLTAGPAWAQANGETVRFQDAPGLGNLPIRVAISKGYCKDAGLKCELVTIPSAPLGAQAMMAGSIESSLGPMSVVNDAVLKGARMKMVAGAAVSNLLILVAGNHVATPNAGKGWPAFMQDFKGRKVGVIGRGTATEVYTDWMLLKAGLKPEDVTFVSVGNPNTGYGALVSKQVDFLMSVEPIGSMCEVLKTCKVLWRAASDKEPAEMYALNGSGVSYVFMQDYIDKHPKVIEAVIKVVKKADAFINNPANFGEVKKIAEQYFKFSMPKGDEIFTATLKTAIDTRNYSPEVNRKANQGAIDLLLETGQIKNAAAITDMVYANAP